jgi:phage protein D
MGYGDRTQQALLLAGYITAVGTSFAEGASPDLEVSGQDALYRLTLGTRDHRVEKGSVEDAVAKVAKDNNFTLDFKGTPPSDVTLDSNMQSDMDFLRKVAENFSKPKEKWEFFSRAGEAVDYLYFRPRSVSDPEVGALSWGEDLLSFKPEANLGNQISRVAVHGWNELTKEAILGEARAEREDPNAKTGAEIQNSFLTREVVRELRLPVRTTQEANDRAAAELAKSLVDHL